MRTMLTNGSRCLWSTRMVSVAQIGEVALSMPWLVTRQPTLGTFTPSSPIRVTFWGVVLSKGVYCNCSMRPVRSSSVSRWDWGPMTTTVITVQAVGSVGMVRFAEMM